MAIKKQEFYEGAALHVLARSGHIDRLRHAPPFFVFNDQLWVLIKYCARIRNPWGFTFTPSEQLALSGQAQRSTAAIALVCGSDGIAALDYFTFQSVAPIKTSSVHISCYRDHWEHYEVNGPEGKVPNKIPPSSWQRILSGG